MKNIVLIDMPKSDEWDFTKNLCKQTKLDWEEISCTSNGSQKSKLKKLINVYAKYFLFPFKIFINRKKYSRVIAWQQFYGIILSFYCRLFKVKKAPKIYIMTLIYVPKKGLLGKIYYKFMKYSLNSKYINKIFVYTRNEINSYSFLFGLDKSKIIFIPVGIGSSEIKLVGEKKEYYLSAGRTNRDYDFLVDAWPEDGPELVILCDIYKPKIVKKNVKIYDNIFGDQYLKMLSESKALIVSLGNNNVSSGQLSFLNGLKAGKAIIVIENEAIIDYAKNEVNCLVVEKNKKVFSKYIKGLTSQKIKEIEEKSYDYFIENYTISKMAERIGEVINEDVN